jgi:hypothetical protein
MGRDRTFLYTSGFAGVFCHPVTVLARGPKQATVKLRYAASFAGRRHLRGAVIRVPSYALGGPLWRAFFSVGRHQFERWGARHRSGLIRRYLSDLGMDLEAPIVGEPKRGRR